MSDVIFVCAGKDPVWDEKLRDYLYCGCDKCAANFKKECKKDSK